MRNTHKVPNCGTAPNAVDPPEPECSVGDSNGEGPWERRLIATGRAFSDLAKREPRSGGDGNFLLRDCDAALGLGAVLGLGTALGLGVAFGFGLATRRLGPGRGAGLELAKGSAKLNPDKP